MADRRPPRDIFPQVSLDYTHKSFSIISKIIFGFYFRAPTAEKQIPCEPSLNASIVPGSLHPHLYSSLPAESAISGFRITSTNLKPP